MTLKQIFQKYLHAPIKNWMLEYHKIKTPEQPEAIRQGIEIHKQLEFEYMNDSYRTPPNTEKDT